MSEGLSEKVVAIMEGELAALGRTMLEKECHSLMIDVGDIRPEELPALASRMSELMKTCGGYAKARKVYAEIRNLQDLDELAESQSSAAERMRMLEDLAKASLYAGEWSKAKDYLTKLLKGATSPPQKVHYLRLLGMLYRDKSEYATAMKHLRMALEEGMRSGVKEELSRINSLMGDVYWFTGYHQSALECHNRAVETAATEEDVAVAHIGIANVYNNRQEFAKAITHYVEALGHLKGATNLRQTARAYNNLGDVYLQMMEWDNALENLEKGRQMAEKSNYPYILSYCLYNSAEALVNLGRLDEAEDILEKSISIFKQIGNKSGLAGAYTVSGLLARHRKDWGKMIKFYNMAIDEYSTHEIPHYAAKSRQELAAGYVDMGDVPKAMDELELALETFVELNLDKNADQVKREMEALK